MKTYTEHGLVAQGSILYAPNLCLSRRFHPANQMTSAIEAFFLAMVLNPSVQERAQAEIDSVCGNSTRLPVFTDKPKLPFIEALLTEVLRWTIITPMGLPHRFTKDEYHGGYLFPKDSYAFANIG
jgi:cytochrome P450